MSDEDAAKDAAPASPKASWFGSIFTPKGAGAIDDPELRERMRTLDTLETRWGYAAGALSLVIAVILVPSLLHNTKELVTSKPLTGNACASPSKYDAATKLCQQLVVHHPSEFYLEFALYAVLGSLLLFAVWKSKRSLTIFMGFLIFLATLGSLPGILIAAYAGWLLLRSFRLQRYGATDSKTVRAVATARAADKRAAKRAPKVVVPPTGKVVPPRSKRYTPKAKAPKK